MQPSCVKRYDLNILKLLMRQRENYKRTTCKKQSPLSDDNT